MSYALAYFITWSTYGARLHGDPRGSVDQDHNLHGRPFVPEQLSRERFERDELKHPPFVLSPAAREVVARTIHDHAEHREWTVHALNARSTHVHVVVQAPRGVEPETMMGQFKASGSRRLRERGLIGEGARVWTPHGSTKHLVEAEGLMSTVHYVADLQDHPGRFGGDR